MPPRGSLLAYFIATYVVTWSLFLTVAAFVPASTPLGRALILLGAYSPSFAALALTARHRGSAGVREVLAPIVRWRVGAQWYLFAAGFVVALKLAGAVIYRVVLGAWPAFGRMPWFLIPIAVAFSTPFQAGEEIGWRGYALPRLGQRLGLAGASLVLGVIWGVWHLPQFFIRGTDSYGQSFFVFVLQVVPISVALAWLWARTGGSLLLPMLLHSAVNNSSGVVTSALPAAAGTFSLHASPMAWISTALLWLCAAPMLAGMASTGVAAREPSGDGGSPTSGT